MQRADCSALTVSYKNANRRRAWQLQEQGISRRRRAAAAAYHYHYQSVDKHLSVAGRPSSLQQLQAVLHQVVDGCSDVRSIAARRGARHDTQGLAGDRRPAATAGCVLGPPCTNTRAHTARSLLLRVREQLHGGRLGISSSSTAECLRIAVRCRRA